MMYVGPFQLRIFYDSKHYVAMNTQGWSAGAVLSTGFWQRQQHKVFSLPSPRLTPTMAHHDGQPCTYRQGLMGQHVTVRRICLGNMGLISRNRGFPRPNCWPWLPVMPTHHTNTAQACCGHPDESESVLLQHIPTNIPLLWVH